MIKDNKAKGKISFSLLSIFFFLFLLNLVSANSQDNCNIFGNCKPAVTTSTGGNVTNIFNQNFTNINQTLNTTNNITYQAANFSILVDWANLTSIPSYVKDWNSSGLIINWSSLLNGTGLIKDWNISGYIINWNSTGYIQNWNQTGYIANWNNTGLIQNWSNIITQTNYNASGLILNWSNIIVQTNYNASSLILNWSNQPNYAVLNLSNASALLYVNSSGLIMNWSNIITSGSGITNGSSAWLQSLGIGTSNPNASLDINSFKPLQFQSPAQNFWQDGSSLITPAIYWNNTIFVNQGDSFNNYTTYQLIDNTSQNNIMTIILNDTSGLPSSADNFLDGVYFGFVNRTAGNYTNGISFTRAGSGYLTIASKNDILGISKPALIVQDVSSAGSNFLALFMNGRVGVNTSNPRSSLEVIGNFSVRNTTAALPAAVSYITTILSTGNLNTTGVSAGTGSIVSYVQTGMLLNLTTYGTRVLPPFTGAICSNSTNPTFNGTIMKNLTGVYGCKSSNGQWTLIF